ncbi:MAG: N-6 DNA methylase [Magnetospirillum gryphiswaldense]|nr:N-6 DNA methylase [Magnetospirillum gryphiswaldense]
MNSVPFLDRRSAIRLTGAVYTPTEVAAAVIRLAMKELPKRRLSVLEPSVGDGAFLRQLGLFMPDHDHVAVDIDAKVVETLRNVTAFWPQSTALHAADFIQFACDAIEARTSRYDFITGNPPFIRKHNFPAAFKLSLQRLSDLTSYPLPDLKNSWAAFLVASAKLVTDDGLVAFVLPYELITVAYGHAVLNKMLELFSRIDLFVSDEKAFPEIEQDAVIFLGRKGATQHPGLFVQRVKHMSDLENAVEHPLALESGRPLALDLNAFLIDPKIMSTLRCLQADLDKFSDLATSAPGVVTAANQFFILKDAEVARLGVQAHVLPIIKKQSVLNRSPIFSKNDFSEVAKREPCRFLCVKGDLESLDPNVRAYIAEGAKTELPKRYKCRGRKNWYEVRLVPSAPGFFFKRSHGFPRLCINEADVHITDTAYGIRPKEGYTIRGICYSFYNSLTMLFAETNGRFYGGGVLELSPNELKSLPIVYREPTDEEFEAFVRVHKEAGNDPAPILDFGDRWLCEHPAMRNVNLADIRKAWIAVRSHRLRHSSRMKA